MKLNLAEHLSLSLFSMETAEVRLDKKSFYANS